MGRMVPRKGVDNVIKALDKLRNGDCLPKLVIVGGETDQPDPATCPEMQRLKDLAMKKGLLSSIIFVGRKDRSVLRYYYSAADIFITTPWYAPFGLTPLEAMACGTPVIGSNVGGLKFSIEDGKTGFLVPPNDPEALAQKISMLMEDRQLLRNMKANALMRVHALFTWTKVADMVDKTYQAILPPAGMRSFRNQPKSEHAIKPMVIEIPALNAVSNNAVI
jgi:glycosyltransferase involved in cell wall biosynthesis